MDDSTNPSLAVNDSTSQLETAHDNSLMANATSARKTAKFSAVASERRRGSRRRRSCSWAGRRRWARLSLPYYWLQRL